MTLTKSVLEQTDIDAADLSEIEFIVDSDLRDRINRMSIGKVFFTYIQNSIFSLISEERIRYLENVRKYLKDRRETEVFTQGIIIVVVFVMLAFVLYYSL